MVSSSYKPRKGSPLTTLHSCWAAAKSRRASRITFWQAKHLLDIYMVECPWNLVSRRILRASRSNRHSRKHFDKVPLQTFCKPKNNKTTQHIKALVIMNKTDRSHPRRPVTCSWDQRPSGRILTRNWQSSFSSTRSTAGSTLSAPRDRIKQKLRSNYSMGNCIPGAGRKVRNIINARARLSWNSRTRAISCTMETREHTMLAIV